MLHVSDRQRRDRIALRHGIDPARRRADAEDATRAVAVLHATEPATVHLSLQARVDGLRRSDVERVLHEERTLVKQLAMRRTLFVLPRDLLPAAWGSASARVAGTERARLAKDAEAHGLADPGGGAAWVERARREVLGVVAGSVEGRQAAEVRAAVPALAAPAPAAGAPSSSVPPTVSRLLTLLGAEAEVVRGVNTGHWRVSRPRWAPMAAWLGEEPRPWSASDGWAELVRRWLGAFGPGTEADLVWWLGSTKGIVRAALARLEAVEVALDGGATGWLLPDDDLLDHPLDGARGQEVGPWAALLPVLDPTVMGWKERAFYLGPHRDALFDRNGNAGTTAWWDGRVVGCWVQDEAGRVLVRLLEEVPAAGRAALEAEADRLSDWLAGERVGTVYPSPAMRAPA